MDLLLQDIRHAVRGLVREPGFAAIAILTLALGMGATTAMFGVVRGVLLAPLPYSDADSRVMIWSRWTGWDKTWVSPIEIQDYRQRVRSLRGVAEAIHERGRIRHGAPCHARFRAQRRLHHAAMRGGR